MKTHTVGRGHLVNTRALGLAAALWALPGLPSASSAQVAVDTVDAAGAPVDDARRDEGRWGCLQGAPPPECASIWIVELQASTPLVAPTYERGESSFRYRTEAAENQYEWNVGHLVALGDGWAVGGAVTLGTGADDVFTGLRARARRWVGEAVSLELEAGLSRSNGSHHWLRDQTGWSTGVRFNVLDYGAAFVRYDVYDVSGGSAFPGSPAALITGPQHIVRGGVGLGGGAALAGTGVVLISYAVLLGLFLASGGAS